MQSKEGINYIEEQLKAGYSADQITKSMKESGWAEEDILEMFAEVQKDSTTKFSAPKVSKKLLISIIAVVVVLGLGATAYGFGLHQIFFSSPEKALAGIPEAMQNLKSGKYTAAINFNVASEPISSTQERANTEFDLNEPFDGAIDETLRFKGGVNINGSFDTNDMQNIKSSSIFELNIQDFFIPDVNVSTSLEQISVGKVSYLKLSKFNAPILENFGFTFDTQNLLGKWFKVESTEEFEQFGIDANQTLDLVSKQKLEQLSKNIDFKQLFNTDYQGKAEINGSSTYHFKYTINKDYLVEFTQQLNTLMGENSPLSAEEINEYKNELAKIGELGGEVWVDKNSYLYKITFQMTGESTKDDLKSSYNITLETNWSDHNKQVNIAAPAEYEDLGEIFNSSIEDARAKARDAKRIADIKAIRIAQELYIDSTGKYALSLDELIDEYLPEVLTDPFTENPYTILPQGENSYYVIFATEGNTELGEPGTYCVNPLGIHSHQIGDRECGPE